MKEDNERITQHHYGVGDNIAGDKYVYNIQDNEINRAFAQAVLIGAWNESSEGEINTIECITGEKYDIWIKRIQLVLSYPDSPIAHHLGKWEITNRVSHWSNSLSYIYKIDLERLERAILKCFSVIDKKLELDPDKRFASALYGIKPLNSPELRTGLADGLALLSIRSADAANCTHNHCAIMSERIATKLLSNSSWEFWASNCDIIGQLSEAAPEQYLSALENLMEHSPTTISELFKQTHMGGMGGTNYMSCIIGTLERLAWLPQYITRAVLALGGLHILDPGGKYATTPKKAIINILSPEAPCTFASFERRLVALNVLTEELPDVGWAVSIELLPQPASIRFESRKPQFLRPPTQDDGSKRTPEQASHEYAAFMERLVDLAKKHDSRVVQLFSKILAVANETASLKAVLDFASDFVQKMSEEVKYEVWRSLRKTTKAIRTSSYIMALVGSKNKAVIDQLTLTLAPKDPAFHSRILFSNDPAELIENMNNWEREQATLEHSRRDALADIYAKGGIQLVLDFIQKLENQKVAGHSLAFVVKNEHADELEKLLKVNRDNIKPFVASYVKERAHITNMEFLQELHISDWDKDSIEKLMLMLPCNGRSWEVVSNMLDPELAYVYWNTINIEWPGYLVYEGPDFLYFSAEQFMLHQRPLVALYCLAHIMVRERAIHVKPAFQVLNNLLSTETPIPPKDYNIIRELVTFLLASSEVDETTKIGIEWAFFQIINGAELDDRHSLHIHQRLSTEPKLFHSLMSIICRSDHNKTQDASSKNDRNAMSNTYKIFESWKIIPGHSCDSFDSGVFDHWLNMVLALSEGSGHTNSALHLIGNLLVNAPSDPGGLWIHLHIAKILNKKNMGKLRDAYLQGIFVSQGVRNIDLEAKPELALANRLSVQAEECDARGFFRLASSLRTLSTEYSERAQSILKEECGFIKSIRDRERRNKN